ncbi:MAG: sugar MFS transporter [Planctomycetota bacterium]|nr:sugar MFS transporter [Planctomycetota bacterium]
MSSEQEEKKTSSQGVTENAGVSRTASMALLTLLFFIWGFLTVLNDILVPYFKKAFELSHFEALLVQSAFFTAYFVGSLIYFLCSWKWGDPIARMGYKNGLVLGLLIAAGGALMFYPAAQLLSYSLFLGALFVLALGITMIQISANPFVAIMGPEKSASTRLNLSQGFNSLGTTLAPLIGGALILGGAEGSEGAGLSSVQGPYLFIAGVLLILAALFFFVRWPQIQSSGPLERSPVALRFRHLRLGMVAILCYVGAEVSVGSLFIAYVTRPSIGIAEGQADNYLAMYWGGLMIGRFLGAISSAGALSFPRKIGAMTVSAALCFGLIFLAISVKNPNFAFSDIAPFLLVIGLSFGAFLLGRFNPSRTLTVFAFCCVALLMTTALSSGALALWSVIAVGLFNSIMWSNIFTLSIEGLGDYKSQGSSLLVMMIIGGALLPPLQGLIVDQTGSMPLSFLLPASAYLYLAYFGFAGYRIVLPEGMKASEKAS